MVFFVPSLGQNSKANDLIGFNINCAAVYQSICQFIWLLLTNDESTLFKISYTRLRVVFCLLAMTYTNLVIWMIIVYWYYRVLYQTKYHHQDVKLIRFYIILYRLKNLIISHWPGLYTLLSSFVGESCNKVWIAAFTNLHLGNIQFIASKEYMFFISWSLKCGAQYCIQVYVNCLWVWPPIMIPPLAALHQCCSIINTLLSQSHESVLMQSCAAIINMWMWKANLCSLKQLLPYLLCFKIKWFWMIPK